MFLDADDLLPPHYLARFVDAAAATPRAEVFHCGWRGIAFDDGRVLYGQNMPCDLDRDPFHILAAGGSPHISSLAVRRTAVTRVGPSTRPRASRRTGTTGSGWLLPGATFQGVPGNVAIIRRRNDSMSASAGSQLALDGLAVTRAASLAPPALPCLHLLGRGSPQLATGCASLVSPGLRASDSSRGPHGAAHRRGSGGRVPAASRASTAWHALREKRRTG